MHAPETPADEPASDDTPDRGAEAVRSRQQELRTALAGGPWHITAEPVAWFYDPPWTLPWRRRNEVAAAVMR